ncbi:hypothetical protein [Saccharopolyspora sp. NPDC002686]|uniref:hypothetical protein n=1 Tax=Saccharopolyspora sp. NPDC002686 TaxID=3154541 RepID=UPI00331C707E
MVLDAGQNGQQIVTQSAAIKQGINQLTQHTSIMQSTEAQVTALCDDLRVAYVSSASQQLLQKINDWLGLYRQAKGEFDRIIDGLQGTDTKFLDINEQNIQEGHKFMNDFYNGLSGTK